MLEIDSYYIFKYIYLQSRLRQALLVVAFRLKWRLANSYNEDLKSEVCVDLAASYLPNPFLHNGMDET